MPSVEAIRAALEEVKDPDFDVGVVGMGLIYSIAVDGSAVRVVMTLTSPMCPHAGTHVKEVKERILALPGVSNVEVDLTFTPPWDPNTMADDEFKALVGIW